LSSRTNKSAKYDSLLLQKIEPWRLAFLSGLAPGGCFRLPFIVTPWTPPSHCLLLTSERPIAKTKRTNVGQCLKLACKLHAIAQNCPKPAQAVLGSFGQLHACFSFTCRLWLRLYRHFTTSQYSDSGQTDARHRQSRRRTQPQTCCLN